MVDMGSRKWFAIFGVSVALALGAAAALVWWIDPYFHYRAPRIDRFRYTLDNQRFQSDGIVKHFDYRALVTGSSMCENFKASDVERLWGLKTVKVPFSGASYREICRIVCTANAANPDLELVIVGLDLNKLAYDKDWMRTDLGTFPDYLYDEDPWNDIGYLLNADAVWKSLRTLFSWGRGGITSFDAYSCWHTDETRYGRKAVLGEERYVPSTPPNPESIRPFSETERRLVRENFAANILPMIRSSKRIMFFLTPYSMARFYHWERSGDLLKRHPGAVDQFVDLLLEQPKARLFFFGDRMDLVGNLDNYRDQDHYGPWVNTQILEWMHRGEGELTGQNRRTRLEELREIYSRFDYRSLFDSEVAAESPAVGIGRPTK